MSATLNWIKRGNEAAFSGLNSRISLSTTYARDGSIKTYVSDGRNSIPVAGIVTRAGAAEIIKKVFKLKVSE